MSNSIEFVIKTESSSMLKELLSRLMVVERDFDDETHQVLCEEWYSDCFNFRVTSEHVLVAYAGTSWYHFLVNEQKRICVLDEIAEIYIALKGTECLVASSAALLSGYTREGLSYVEIVRNIEKSEERIYCMHVYEELPDLAPESGFAFLTLSEKSLVIIGN